MWYLGQQATGKKSPEPPSRELQTIRNIGVMAHIDAGKTTSTERMLYATKRFGQIRLDLVASRAALCRGQAGVWPRPRVRARARVCVCVCDIVGWGGRRMKRVKAAAGAHAAGLARRLSRAGMTSWRAGVHAGTTRG